MVIFIGRGLGQYMEVDYNQEAAVRMEYVRVQVNWNINAPLRFRRMFQFTLGVNTLLRLTYEGLHGLCEVCGLLTHDTGACLICNCGPDDDSNGQFWKINTPTLICFSILSLPFFSQLFLLNYLFVLIFHCIHFLQLARV